MHRRAIMPLVSPLVLLALAGGVLAQNTDRVSVTSTGAAASTSSGSPHITPGGRYVVFTSVAPLVPDDTNGRNDVYVRDRVLNSIHRISIPDPSLGGESNGTSILTNGSGRVISDNGRFIIFTSDADNLVANDTNGVSDVFVHDRDFDGNGLYDEAGVGKTKTVRVSLSSGEGQGNGPCPNQICDHYSQAGVISASGRYVAWESQYGFTNDNTAFMNVYWRDRDADNDGIFDEAGGNPDAAVTRLVSKRIGSQLVGQTGDGFSQHPAISADGRWVAFESASRFMVFSDGASGLEIFARDMFTNLSNVRITKPIVSAEPDADSSNPTVSADGRYVAFVTGANNLASGVNPNFSNIVIKDRDSDNNGVLDEAGGVAFINASIGRNPFALPNGVVTLNNSASAPTISDDGRYVAFHSDASNYACALGCVDTNGTSDVFVYDRVQNASVRASVARDGAQGGGESRFGHISPDGRFVGFASNSALLDGSVSTAFNNSYVRALLGQDNDDCSGAIPATPNVFISGDTWGASATGEVSCGFNVGATSAVWYSYVAPCTGQMTITTVGSQYDTVLSVYDGGCPATLAKLVACNDDAPGAPAPISQVVFGALRNHAYLIRVGGYNFDAGVYYLNVTPPTCTPCTADFNGDGVLDPDDLSDFIACYFSAPPCPQADFNADTHVDPDDLSDYIALYFGGCP